jgi:hypothetical protein
MALQSTDYEGRFKELQALEDKKDDLIVVSHAYHV